MHWPRRLLERPREVLGGLVVLQWLLTGALAATVTHNGWVYYQGGDQIWYSSSAWLLGRLELPVTLVSGGWPLLLAPVTWVSGPTFVEALPAIVALNVLVLGPLGLLAFYGLASHIGGRAFGYWSAAAWVVAPFAAIPLFVERYHERYVEQFLPQALGLTGLADYLSMILLVCGAYLTVRAIRLPSAGLVAAAVAGLVAGYAVWVKPANALFLLGAALAFAVAHRWRQGAAFAVALLPAVLTLALWKYRGLGSLPVLAFEEVHVAAGAAFSVDSVTRYVDLDVEHFGDEMAQLREYFWSARVAQWVPFAGTLALARIAPAAAALVAGWLGAFLVVKGMSPLSSITSGTFFRLLMPAWPAYLLLLAAVPLLVPGAVRRLRAHVAAPARGPGTRAAAAAAVVLGAVPLVAVAAARPLEGPDRAVVQKIDATELLTPVLPELRLTVERKGESRILHWQPERWRGDVFYRVYRTPLPGDDVECVVAGAAKCTLAMIVLGSTFGTSLVDGSPPPGSTYRLGVGTNWLGDLTGGDVFAIGPPVRG